MTIDEDEAERIRREFARGRGDLQHEKDVEDVRRAARLAEKLSPWEGEFLASVVEQVVVEGRRLSEKQRAIVERIIAKKGGSA